MGILDLFHRNSYSCDFLNTNLQFTNRDTLEACCGASIGPVLADKLSQKDSIKEFIKNREKYIKQLKAGSLKNGTAGCKNCINLKKYKQTNDYRIKRITLNHFTACNCACCYCTDGQNRDFVNIRETAEDACDILKFINELYDNDLIDKKNLIVDFQGGEAACLKNHREIIDTFYTRGVKELVLFTNNIVYIPSMEPLLRQDKGSLVVTIDCGTPETFYQIKQVDKFDIVIKNLKRYIEAAGNSHITARYVLIHRLNDNMEELKAFLDLMLEINIKLFVIDIDYRNIIEEDFTIPKHYYELIDYMKEFCRKNRRTFSMWSYTEEVLRRGYSISNRS